MDSMKHLTDLDLQALADRRPCAPEIEEHLQSCAVCRAHLAAYRQIFSELKKDDTPALPKHFARAVIARIEERQEQSAAWREWMFIGLAGMAAVVISIYYAGASMTGDAVTDSVKKLFQSGHSVTSFFQAVQNWFGGGWSYVIFGGLLLLAFNWLDERLIKSKRFSGQH